MTPAKAFSLVETVRYVIVTLTRMAHRNEWGEIRINVQKGQIITVNQNLSFQGHLPAADEQDATLIADQRLRSLAGVG